MDALSSNSSVGAGMYALKESNNVQEKMMEEIMTSLPATTQDTSSSNVSGLASEGIGSNLDLKA